MSNVKEEFIKECIRNRMYLGFTYKDMSNCLINVSEKDYESFEEGNYNMSLENAKRLIRVLCIEKNRSNDILTKLDFSDSDLDKEDIEDITNIALEIVGENHD